MKWGDDTAYSNFVTTWANSFDVSSIMESDLLGIALIYLLIIIIIKKIDVVKYSTV